MTRTLISIATYNERKNLPTLIDSIFAYAGHCDVLIVDDASPDGTGKWAEQRAADEPRIQVEHRSGKLGLGTATVLGLKRAIERRYDLVVTMDADLSHDPKYLPAMLRCMTPSVDIVIGSRYIDGGGVEGWPWTRRVMSRMLNAFANFWLGLPVSDSSGAFRCYRTAVLRRMNLDDVQSRGYSVFEELLWRLKRTGACFAEIPIVFVDRQEGNSKVTLREAVTSFWCLIALRFSRTSTG